MSPIQSLTVVVRLFALWIIGYYITSAPWFYVKSQTFNSEAKFYAFGATVAFFVLAAVLWYFSSWIATRLLSGDKNEKFNQSTTFDNWFDVGCSLIGIWVLAKAIPALLHYVIANWLGAEMFPDSYMSTASWKLTAIFNFIQFIFGFSLFLGHRGIRKIVNWARIAGTGSLNNPPNNG